MASNPEVTFHCDDIAPQIARYGVTVQTLDQIASGDDPLRLAKDQLAHAESLLDQDQHLSQIDFIREAFQSIHRALYLIDKQRYWLNEHPAVPAPAYLTGAQIKSIWRLYDRNPDGASSPQEFFARVTDSGIGSDRYAGITWSGMFVGIEKDGESHT